MTEAAYRYWLRKAKKNWSQRRKHSPWITLVPTPLKTKSRIILNQWLQQSRTDNSTLVMTTNYSPDPFYSHRTIGKDAITVSLRHPIHKKGLLIWQIIGLLHLCRSLSLSSRMLWSCLLKAETHKKLRKNLKSWFCSNWMRVKPNIGTSQ